MTYTNNESAAAVLLVCPYCLTTVYPTKRRHGTFGGEIWIWECPDCEGDIEKPRRVVVRAVDFGNGREVE